MAEVPDRRPSRLYRQDLIGVLTTLGLGAVVGSFLLRNENSWWSGFLVEVGVTVLLLAPILAINRHLERRVEDAQREVVLLSDQVDVTRADVARTAEEISQRVSERFAEERLRDEAAFAGLRAAPSREDVILALQIASDRGFISTRGLRVDFPHTGYWLRLILENGNLTLHVEELLGDMVAARRWGSESAIEIFEALGRELLERGTFPGESAYQPGKSLQEAADILTFAARVQTIQGESVKNLLQVVNDDWCVSDHALFPKSRLHYTIALRRLDETDWDQHMRGKPWVDIVNFRMAADIGRALRDGKFG